MKIAFVFSGDLSNRKGAINACISRGVHLKKVSQDQIDFYCIQSYNGGLAAFLRKRQLSSRKRDDSVVIEGLKIQLIWQKFSLIDYILEHRIRSKAFIRSFFLRGIRKMFMSYDLLTVHSFVPGELAKMVNDKYGIPYCVTWHGSDIHTEPFRNNSIKSSVTCVMKSASCNFFVSKNLLDTSEKIWSGTNKMLLYNGVETRFQAYGEVKRKDLREKEFKIKDGTKVVAFVGGLLPVKNVELLPAIFNSIMEKSESNVVFWIIGDGMLKRNIESKLIRFPNVKCTLWGNQSTEKMPDFYNVIDLLLLPSKNEGMPLVTLEALSCGSHVIGSNVGGIKESLGNEFVVDLNENFVENFSSLAARLLNEEKIKQSLNPCFNWNETAIIENKFYSTLLNS